MDDAAHCHRWAAGLPPQILRRLSDAMIKAIRTPEASAKLESINYDIWAYTPEEFSAMVKRDFELVTKIIKESQIKLEE